MLQIDYRNMINWRKPEDAQTPHYGSDLSTPEVYYSKHPLARVSFALAILFFFWMLYSCYKSSTEFITLRADAPECINPPKPTYNEWRAQQGLPEAEDSWRDSYNHRPE